MDQQQPATAASATAAPSTATQPPPPIRRRALVRLRDGTEARVKRLQKNGVCDLATPHTGALLCISHLSLLTPLAEPAAPGRRRRQGAAP